MCSPGCKCICCVGEAVCEAGRAGVGTSGHSQGCLLCSDSEVLPNVVGFSFYFLPVKDVMKI